MKRQISDLLDTYRPEALDPAIAAPLSSQRIKELTMSKVKKTKKVRSLGTRLLVAAAIISLLGVSAIAAEQVLGAGDFFRDVLNQQLEQEKLEAVLEAELPQVEKAFRDEISQGQLEAINEMGTVFQEMSVTDQGTTMTLKAAYGDENQLHLYFHVEAPEGVVLPDGILYEFCDYNSDEKDMLLVPEDSYERNGYSINVQPVEDADPTDNCKDFYVSVTSQAGEGIRFNDGVSKYLRITGVYEQVVNLDGDQDGYVPLCTGQFTFDVGIVNEVEMVELDVDGLRYGGVKTRTWTWEGEEKSETFEYYVTAKRLRISPLSVEWKCDFACDNDRRSFSLQMQIVMKDGTSPTLNGVMGNSFSETSGEGTYTFTIPIDLDEVDYILIGDPDIGSTHKVYLPEVTE